VKNMKGYGFVVVGVINRETLAFYGDFDAKLLKKLSFKALLKCFSGLSFPSRELPHTAQVTSLSPL